LLTKEGTAMRPAGGIENELKAATQEKAAQFLALVKEAQRRFKVGGNRDQRASQMPVSGNRGSVWRQGAFVGGYLRIQICRVQGDEFKVDLTVLVEVAAYANLSINGPQQRTLALVSVIEPKAEKAARLRIDAYDLNLGVFVGFRL
jgi:hypothetical protein